ncbi:MAG: energy transducer TonB [Bryobacteraceae bacterium]
MPRRDILSQSEPVSRPLLGSIGAHGGILALVLLYSSTQGQSVEKWGDPKSLGGGAVGITPVNKIPLPSRRGHINPVANDTESQIPSAPVKPQPQPKAPPPDPDAIAIKGRARQKSTAAPQYSPVQKPKPNQIYSSTGQAVTSPLFSQAPGGGNIGSGSNSPFGNRFGWYEALLREKVARNWRSQELDAGIRNVVIVTFEIIRNGTVRDVRVTRSSGNFTMDQSAQRAILTSSPFQPLPPQFERDAALIEFWFRLQQ